MIIEVSRKAGEPVDKDDLSVRAEAFMARVGIAEHMKDTLRPLLVAQAMLLIEVFVNSTGCMRPAASSLLLSSKCACW